MDIVAKRLAPDKNGVRIAELDEKIYRRVLWEHRPLTDFWRVGKGYERKLESHGMYTMGDIALRSLCNEEQLYKLFGINAELLIDHAWGYEPCTIADIKAYKPMSKSLNSGQVLQSPYSYGTARIVLQEMCDSLVLDMVAKGVATNQIVITIGYDTESLKQQGVSYTGEITVDHYGRAVPKHAHGTENFKRHTSSTDEIMRSALLLYDRIIDKNLLIRRINISVNNLVSESERAKEGQIEQLDFFTDYKEAEEMKRSAEESYAKEKQKQNALLSIKKKYGGNAILRGISFEEGATGIERNAQIGGHKA
jgi:DNA polymerase V